MDKDEFAKHLRLLLEHLRQLTSEMCFNNLSDNYKFLLEPSDRTVGAPHLTDTENSYLEIWNRINGKELSFEQAVEHLYKENKTPKWADCSVYYASKNKTVVHIYFSRQFRNDNEIYYLDRGTGPFKAVVTTPHDHSEVSHTSKFDVNWKKRFDDRRLTIFSRIRRLFN